MNEFSVHVMCWRDGEPLLRAVRETVFVREQNVPVELEWDGRDESCRHVLALDGQGNAIGCGRITRDGHIGRMAVLRGWRRRKVGRAMLEALLDYARSQHFQQVELNGQVQALPFYRRFGFVEEGEEFTEAGIPHRMMRLLL
ncbi:MAG: GNAT family N-acetyltransferase [Gallionellaceae bacterium]